MVELMRGVTAPGGTAAGVSAAGHLVAGKTGTVNDHTDVWFIGYTPTYVTGVWMGNPTKKEDLGSYMTGGHGAMPYFNAFMNVYMKDKPKETFYETPPMPAEIKALAAQRDREEQEKLEKASEEGAKLGGTIASGGKGRGKSADASTGDISTEAPVPIDPTENTIKPDAPAVSKPVEEVPKPTVKPITPPAPVKKPEAAPEKPAAEGAKRKGKKGDGDNR